MKNTRTAPTVAELEVLKSRSIAQRTMRCGRLINELGFEAAQRANPDLRPAHLSLMPYLEHHGSRITNIAERAAISKQAVSVLVAELTEMGILEAVPDPSDGRAKLIRFTTLGRSEIARGLALLADIDTRIETTLGAARSRALLKALAEIDTLLTPSD